MKDVEAWRNQPGSISPVCDEIAEILDVPFDLVRCVGTELIARGFLPASRGRKWAILTIEQVFLLLRATLGAIIGVRPRDFAGFAHRISSMDRQLEEAMNSPDIGIEYDYAVGPVGVRISLPAGAAWRLFRLVKAASTVREAA